MWPYEFTWPSPPEGGHVLTAIVTSVDGSTDVSEEVGIAVIGVPASDPVAEIVTPTNGAEVTGPVVITGTAGSPILRSFRLSYRPATPEGSVEDWVPFAQGAESVVAGPLGTFDPTLLLNGLYELRLEVEDRLGTIIATAPVTISVDGGMKLGQVTLSMQDMALETPGLPLTVTRTYDSRHSSNPGDFGFGWRVGLDTVRVESFGMLGEGWNQFLAGINQSFFTYYCVEPTQAHRVAVTFPDGRCEVFEASIITPNHAGIQVGGFAVPPIPLNCQYLAPVALTHFVFSPVHGSRGRLRLAVDTAAFNPGGSLGEITFATESRPSTPFEADEFVFTDDDGTEYTLHIRDGLRKVRDPNGNEIVVSDGGIRHSNGAQLIFTRDSEGRISALTDPAGRQVHYAYDALGNLTAVTNRAGEVTGFRYTDARFPHFLTEIIDGNGVRAARNEFDGGGRMVRQIDPDGRAVELTHDIEHRRQDIRDRLGHVTRHEFDARGNIIRSTDALGGVTTRTYDARDNETSITDPLGHTISRTFDASGNMLSETDPLGNTTTYSFDRPRRPLTITDPLGRVTSFEYDAVGNLTALRAPLGQSLVVTTLSNGAPHTTTDALGNVTTYGYDSAGRVVSHSISDPAGRVVRRTTMTRDVHGNEVTRTNYRSRPDGTEQAMTTTMTYDNENRLVETTNPDGSRSGMTYTSAGHVATTTDTLGHVTEFFYDSRGYRIRTRFPDGTESRTEFDAAGRQVASIDAAGRITTTVYDALGRTVEAISPSGRKKLTSYDAAGRQLSSTDSNGNATTHTYDAAGRRITSTNALGEITTFSYDAVGRLVTTTDPGGNTITSEHDAAGRVIRTIFPDGSETSTTYDPLGRRTSATNEEGRTTAYEYDAQGHLTAVIDALGQRTEYTYDEQGHQLTQMDALGRITRYEWDVMGRRTRRTLPEGQSEGYSYNEGGRLIGRTDFMGFTTTFAHDTAGRVTEKHADPGHPSHALQHAPDQVFFAYDSLGRRTVASVYSADGGLLHSRAWTYDDDDRVATVSSSEGTLIYDYDDAGNLTRVRSDHADGVDASYSYDALNRVATATDASVVDQAGQAQPVTYPYHPAGTLAAVVYPNGVRHDYSYDLRHRVTACGISDAAGQSLLGFAYAFSLDGQRTRIDEMRSGQPYRTVSYLYDALDRLTRETISGTGAGTAPAGQVEYTLDAVGNRIARQSSVAGVENQSFAYTGNDWLGHHGYDANGNTLGSPAADYDSGIGAPPTGGIVTDDYDFENRLIRRTQPDGTVIDLLYDADGNRVAKSVSANSGNAAKTTRFLVDTNNLTGYSQVFEESTAPVADVLAPAQSFTLTSVYCYGLDLISQSRATTGSSFAHHYHIYDAGGHVRALADPSGTLTDTFSYDAFGILIEHTGSTETPHLYRGEYWDHDLHLYFNRARHLNPATGRFQTMDGFEGDSAGPTSLHK